MKLVRQFTSKITGKPSRSDMDAQAFSELQAADVPVSTADCRNCADPCDEGHEEYPKKFDIDFETEMRGSVKPYRRQVIISTGKTDWQHEVTEEEGSLAAHLSKANEKMLASAPKMNGEKAGPPPPAGVFTPSTAMRLAVLNGSLTTCTEDRDMHTVLVMPDFKAISGVAPSALGAETLWKSVLDPTLGSGGAADLPRDFKTWTLPYNCVILLCSHKKRDNRCAIAAPKLETTFIHMLHAEGWEVDTQLDDLSSTGQPLEDIAGTPEVREAEIRRRLHATASQEHKRALILKNSHIGGHKFAGNVIIHTPYGVSVWYGRVTPHEVLAIVQNTILEGKVLPSLFRGGMNVSRPGCKSLHDW